MVDTSGTWVLGHNQRQRGSELQAGARAELIQSPITHALSTLQGRMAARTLNMLYMGRLIGLLNYAGFRPFAVMEIVKLALASVNDPKPLVVDPVGGYSPQFIWLAEALPDVDFIEIDLPDVMQDKRERLQTFDLPTNFQMVAADLSESMLHDVLEGRKVSVMLGMGAYVPHEAYSKLLNYLRTVLTEQGKVIGEFPFAKGVDNLKVNSALFNRFAGNLDGMIYEEQELLDLFENSAYQLHGIFKLGELARVLNKPTPAEVEIFTIAQPRKQQA